MTLPEFVDKWRFILAGGFLYGADIDSEPNTPAGKLTKTAHSHRIPAQVERILTAMYRDLVGSPETKPPAPSQNGKAAETKKV